MPLPRKFKTIFMERPWQVRQVSNNKIVQVKFAAGIRVRQFLYEQGNIITTLGFTNQPGTSSDTPPSVGNILIYKNDKAAARNGWVGELGFILLRRAAPTEEENKENPTPNPGAIIGEEKSSIYYRFGANINIITGALYGMVWNDPVVTGGTYVIRAGTIHQIKHRNTTPYF